MDRSSLPEITPIETLQQTPQERHWVYFLITTVLAIGMLGAMTVYFGFKERQETARDLAQLLIQREEASVATDMKVLARLGLSDLHDAESVSVCRGADCASAERPENPAVLIDFARLWPTGCGAALRDDRPPRLMVQVCVSSVEVFEDIGRDVVVLGAAQLLGFLIWLTSNHRYAARRRSWQQQMTALSTCDAATGLQNRMGLKNRMAAAGDALRSQWLYLLGIDGLKAINDVHGHAAGDAVIERVARRLIQCYGRVGLLARTGGDEFGLLLPVPEGSDPAAQVAAIREAMDTPILFEDLKLVPTLSIGATPLKRCADASEALRRGHVALQTAKRAGRGLLEIFDAAQDAATRRQHALRTDLSEAIRHGQLSVRYQPLVDGSGQVVAAEALARWHHPRFGEVPPDVFIPLAEASGAIHELGLFVARRACADLIHLRAQGCALRHIAVNVSMHQLQPGLVSAMRAAVESAGLQPSDLALELTESAAMAADAGGEMRLLHELAEVGFPMAIDDFGTGHSSLSRLQQLPVRTLKIDRAFVSASDTHSGAVLLGAMMTLARQLQLVCVCEGVETRQQFEWLRARGCDLFQGYYFGRPMARDDFDRHVRSGGPFCSQAEAA